MNAIAICPTCHNSGLVISINPQFGFETRPCPECNYGQIYTEQRRMHAAYLRHYKDCPICQGEDYCEHGAYLMGRYLQMNRLLVEVPRD